MMLTKLSHLTSGNLKLPMTTTNTEADHTLKERYLQAKSIHGIILRIKCLKDVCSLTPNLVCADLKGVGIIYLIVGVYFPNMKF